MITTQYSEVLQQNITIDKQNRRVITSDGVTYARTEMKRLKGQPGEVIRCIHAIKKIFAGKIVESDRRVQWHYDTKKS